MFSLSNGFRRRGRNVLSWLIPVGGTAATVYLLDTYVGSIHRVSGNSMEPTLYGIGGKRFFSDWVFVKKWRLDPGVDCRVGDVVVLTSPTSQNRLLVKRITAMPNQFSRYRSPRSGVLNLAYVRPGHCWVQGDNDAVSIDSRQFGSVSLDTVKGKVNVVVFPPWRIGRIGDGDVAGSTRRANT